MKTQSENKNNKKGKDAEKILKVHKREIFQFSDFELYFFTVSYA